MRQAETVRSRVRISSTLAVALVCALAACTSRFADDSEEALIRDLITIREWDGHTGFNSPEGHLRVTIAHTLGAIGAPAEAALPSLTDGALQTRDAEYRRACRTAMRWVLGPEPDACR